jgi:hypothetical protein
MNIHKLKSTQAIVGEIIIKAKNETTLPSKRITIMNGRKLLF